jgi:hypothetical protein
MLGRGDGKDGRGCGVAGEDITEYINNKNKNKNKNENENEIEGLF